MSLICSNCAKIQASGFHSLKLKTLIDSIEDFCEQNEDDNDWKQKYVQMIEDHIEWAEKW